MDNCKQCGALLTHIEGRKKKSFCGDGCKNKHFNGLRKVKLSDAAAVELSRPIEKKTVATKMPEHAATATRHPLFKEGDPKEGTAAFFMKYSVNSYDEIK